MTEPRIDSITYTMRRGSPPRKLKEGDEKFVKGALMVRQQAQSLGRSMVSNGRPVWEWVQWGGTQDRLRFRGRYRTFRAGLPIPAPPDGWKIRESGRPVPEGYLVFIEPYGSSGEPGWRVGEAFHGFEATYEGERRAFAVPKTDNEITRDIFEKICVCITEGKVRKQPGSVSANVAVKKYMARCKCGMGIQK